MIKKIYICLLLVYLLIIETKAGFINPIASNHIVKV